MRVLISGQFGAGSHERIATGRVVEHLVAAGHQVDVEGDFDAPVPPKVAQALTRPQGHEPHDVALRLAPTGLARSHSPAFAAARRRILWTWPLASTELVDGLPGLLGVHQIWTTWRGSAGLFAKTAPDARVFTQPLGFECPDDETLETLRAGRSWSGQRSYVAFHGSTTHDLHLRPLLMLWGAAQTVLDGPELVLVVEDPAIAEQARTDALALGATSVRVVDQADASTVSRLVDAHALISLTRSARHDGLERLALATGIPILGTAVTQRAEWAHPDFVTIVPTTENTAGWFPDANALVHALDELNAMPMHELRRRGEVASRTILASSTWSQVMDQVERGLRDA